VCKKWHEFRQILPEYLALHLPKFGSQLRGWDKLAIGIAGLYDNGDSHDNNNNDASFTELYYS
jgi:hypothetical protein